MENKKSIFAGSMIASAIIGFTSFSASASSISNYSTLGTGGEVRAELLSSPTSAFGTFELACGTKTTEAKGKEGKCGEAKCGKDKKKEAKGKEAKCGEGKCGEGKKKKPAKK